MKSFVLLVSLIPFVLGCSTTSELQRARALNDERITTYSPITGESHRVPTKPAFSEEESPRAMPRDMAYSYSPITGELNTVQVPKGRVIPARPRTERPRMVVSYSPLTGRAVIVPDVH